MVLTCFSKFKELYIKYTTTYGSYIARFDTKTNDLFK